MASERFVQIEKREGVIRKVRKGTTPIVVLRLWDTERLVSIDLRETMFEHPRRKTSEWFWTAYIETDCGEIPAAVRGDDS